MDVSIARIQSRGIFVLAMGLCFLGCSEAKETEERKQGKAQPAESSADAKEAEATPQQAKVKTSRVRFQLSPHEKLGLSDQENGPDDALSVRISSEGLGFDPHECLRSNIRNHRPNDITLELDLLAGPKGEEENNTANLPSALGGSRTLPLTCLPATIHIELNGMTTESLYKLSLAMEAPSEKSAATYKAKSPIIQTTAENDELRPLSFEREAGASSAGPGME